MPLSRSRRWPSDVHCIPLPASSPALHSHRLLSGTRADLTLCATTRTPILDTDRGHILSKYHRRENSSTSSRGLVKANKWWAFESGWRQTAETIRRCVCGDPRITFSSHARNGKLIFGCWFAEPHGGVFRPNSALYSRCHAPRRLSSHKSVLRTSDLISYPTNNQPSLIRTS